MKIECTYCHQYNDQKNACCGSCGHALPEPEPASSAPVESQSTGSENPFCEHCKEPDCAVSLDGTCEMIRRYLEAVKRGVHVCRFGISNECDVCGAKFAPNDPNQGRVGN